MSSRGIIVVVVSQLGEGIPRTLWHRILSSIKNNGLSRPSGGQGKRTRLHKSCFYNTCCPRRYSPKTPSKRSLEPVAHEAYQDFVMGRTSPACRLLDMNVFLRPRDLVDISGRGRWYCPVNLAFGGVDVLAAFNSRNGNGNVIDLQNDHQMCIQ